MAHQCAREQKVSLFFHEILTVLPRVFQATNEDEYLHVEDSHEPKVSPGCDERMATHTAVVKWPVHGGRSTFGELLGKLLAERDELEEASI